MNFQSCGDNEVFDCSQSHWTGEYAEEANCNNEVTNVDVTITDDSDNSIQIKFLTEDGVNDIDREFCLP